MVHPLSSRVRTCYTDVSSINILYCEILYVRAVGNVVNVIIYLYDMVKIPGKIFVKFVLSPWGNSGKTLNKEFIKLLSNCSNFPLNIFDNLGNIYLSTVIFAISCVQMEWFFFF